MSNTYGQLLIQAVQDTLETMAFAEVIPVAMRIGTAEPQKVTGHCPTADEAPAIAAAATSAVSAWGDDTNTDSNADDDWGSTESVSSLSVPDWGGGTELPSESDWGDQTLLAPVDESAIPAIVETGVDFSKLVAETSHWCRAQMRVNAPDIHSVWFIVSQGLANCLAQNMYGDMELEADSPLLRDLVAEITNILGGRMMLLLERLGGKFTLTVPEIDFSPPNFSDKEMAQMVTCHVLVDATYPVISAIVFSGEIKGSIE